MPRKLSYEEKQCVLLAAFDDLLYKKVQVRIKSLNVQQDDVMLSRAEWKELVKECEVEQMEQEDEYRITAPVVQFFPIVDRFNLTKLGGNFDPKKLFEDIPWGKLTLAVGGIGAVTGLGTGALIGTAILPGIGTVIGGGIGAVSGLIGGGVTGAVVEAALLGFVGYAAYLHMFKKAGYDKDRPLTSANFLSMMGHHQLGVENNVEVYFSWHEWKGRIKGFAPTVLRINESESTSIKRGGDDLLIQLNPRKEEYRKIEALFRKSMPKAVIHEISENCNEFLLRRYEKCQSEKGICLEELLFHGSRRTDPHYIYGGKTGFDVGHSQGGVWGYGIYFAVDASYSHTYCYQGEDLDEGKCQMLVAKVLIGTYAELPPNNRLRSPPDRYDSVKGKGSDIYIVYENEQCYPAYLITYTTYY